MARAGDLGPSHAIRSRGMMARVVLERCAPGGILHPRGGGTMSNKDRVGHNAKRKPVRTQAEKRAAKREKQQELKTSGKRRKRQTAAHHTSK